MMDKEEIREELSALLDGELTPEKRATVEAKLADSAEMLREVDGLKRVDALFRALPPEPAPDELEARIGKALRPGVLRFRPRSLERKRVWPLLAAAAVFAVTFGGLYFQLRGNRPHPFQVAQSEAPAAAKEEAQFSADREIAADMIAAPQASAAIEMEEGVDDDRAEVFGDVVSQSAPEPVPEIPIVQAEQPRRLALDEPAILPVEALTRRRTRMKESVAETDTSLDSLAPTGDATADSGRLSREDLAPPPAAAPAPAAEPTVPSETEGATLGATFKARKADADTPRRKFEQRDAVWYQQGYTSEPTVPLARDSARIKVLVDTDPGLAQRVAQGVALVFRDGDRWYRVEARPTKK